MQRTIRRAPALRRLVERLSKVVSRTSLAVSLKRSRKLAREELSNYSCPMNGFLVGASPAEPFSGQLSLRLDPETWARLLREMGFASSIVILIPLNRSREGRVNQGAERLQRAVLDVSAGRYREAVRECRDLLEALYSEQDEEFKEFKPTFPKQREAGKDARVFMIRQAILVLTHAAAHDDQVAQTFNWERSDAQAVIGLLASLIRLES